MVSAYEDLSGHERPRALHRLVFLWLPYITDPTLLLSTTQSGYELRTGHAPCAGRRTLQDSRMGGPARKSINRRVFPLYNCHPK